MEKYYLFHPRLSKIVLFPLVNFTPDHLRSTIEIAPAPNSQMGLESSFLPRKSGRLQCRFHSYRQERKACSFQSNPKDPGLPYIRKYSYTSSKNGKAWEETEGLLQRVPDLHNSLLFNRPKKLEGKMEILPPNPADTRQTPLELRLERRYLFGYIRIDPDSDKDSNHFR